MADSHEEATSNTYEGTRLPMGERLGLLDGVKVLDLTGFLAGPFASMILGDLGASVLKIERLGGDSSRGNPPYYFGGDSAYFLAINRNKSSLALDLKSEEGREIMRRLVRDSDIILDNLRAPQREDLGLSFDQLKEVNPQIVSCSVTGFGSDGPYSERPAYDIVVEALAGVMSLTGPHGGPSVRAGVPIGDITAGLYLAIGALAGLEHRRTTGEGRHIDVAMLDSQVSLLTYLSQFYFTSGFVATHQGRAHLSIPTYNTFATSDGGEIVVAANTQGMWQLMCGVLGRTDLVDDPRFLTNPDRLAHRDELDPILRSEFLKRTADDLHHALVAAGVPTAPINSIEQALHDPQVLHRDMVVKVRHRTGEEYTTVGSPIKSVGSAGGEYFSPPGLGEQSRSVLSDLGFSEAEIQAFREAGVVRLGDS